MTEKIIPYHGPTYLIKIIFYSFSINLRAFDHEQNVSKFLELRRKENRRMVHLLRQKDCGSASVGKVMN